MQFFDRSAALSILSDLELSPSNRRLVQYWLSLWSGNALPERHAVKPADLKPLLSNLIMFDVAPARSVKVRLAGTNFNFILGTELTGEDWIELAPPDYRRERLRVFTDIASGAIGRGIRKIDMKTGDSETSEELLLPFRAEADGSPQLVLCHVDWRPQQEFARIVSREQALGEPLAFETIQLPLMQAA
ncbi:MAG: PAS domain-containing protein [Rhizomicrobium sp.]|jgi:hypothetical protein